MSDTETITTVHSVPITPGRELDMAVFERIWGGHSTWDIGPVSTRTQSAMSVLMEFFAYRGQSFTVQNIDGEWRVTISDPEYTGGVGTHKSFPLAACMAILRCYKE